MVTEGTEALRVDSSQRVGIGTASMSSFNGDFNNFVVGSGSGSNGLIVYSGTSNTGSIAFNDTANTSLSGMVRYDHSSDAMSFWTGGANERLRILSGGGLTFNGDTAAANALEDYEEGTWSPNDQQGTDIPNAIGLYVKIGRLVHCVCSFQGTSLNGKTQISNFPFPGQNTQYNGHVNLGYVMWAGGSTAAPFTPKTFYMYNNSQGTYDRAIFANRPGASEWVNTDYQAWTFTYTTAS